MAFYFQNFPFQYAPEDQGCEIRIFECDVPMDEDDVSVIGAARLADVKRISESCRFPHVHHSCLTDDSGSTWQELASDTLDEFADWENWWQMSGVSEEDFFTCFHYEEASKTYWFTQARYHQGDSDEPSTAEQIIVAVRVIKEAVQEQAA